MIQKNNVRRESAKGLVRGIETFVEVCALSILYYAFWDFFYNTASVPLYEYKGKYVLMGIYAIILYAICNNMDGFRFGDLRRLDLGLAQCIGILLTNILTYFQLCLIANKMITPVPMLLITLADFILATLFILIYVYIYRHHYAPHQMIMVYGSDSAVSLKIKMDSRRDKYKVTKLVSIDMGYDKICQEIIKYDTVVLNDIPAQIRNDILKFCYENRIRAYVAPKISDVIMRGAKDISLFDTPLFLVKGVGLTFFQRILKRTTDIILSLIAIVLASPIMLVAALLIKLEDKGPVFYKQKRVTRDEKEFEILKFRSMIVDAEKFTGAQLATENDPRITKVGKFMRATRIDELPQIINILKGDMSIVGPRPERMDFINEFCKEIPEFKYRLKVKGGLTGYAQIYGKYNTNAYDKLRMDLLYIENYSFLLDIKLILTTIRIMFSKDSTEGIDKAQENAQKAKDLIDDLNKNKD